MKTDVAIIGGGAIGASVAYYLKMMDPSVKVTVIERDPTYAIASTPRASGGVRRLFSLPENIALSNYSIPFFETFPETMAVNGQRAEISFKKGGYIAAGIALVLYPFAPWEGNAASFVNGIGATMGPLLGVILVDYYLIAKGHINIQALYQEHGEYRYEGGWNVNALVATGVGAVFSTILPNFTQLLPAWWGTYGWFFGVAIGGVTYWVMSILRPRALPAPARA